MRFYFPCSSCIFILLNLYYFCESGLFFNIDISIVDSFIFQYEYGVVRSMVYIVVDVTLQDTFCKATSPNFPTGLIPVMINYVGRGWLVMDGLNFFFYPRSVFINFLSQNFIISLCTIQRHCLTKKNN